MNSAPFLRCPNGCRTAEDDVKLVRRYGPHHTPLYRCVPCGREFSVRHGSIFAGFHTDDQTIYRVLKALSEGNGIRACARIFDIDKNTVVRILERAARHCQQVSAYLIKNYHMEECQLDELWSFVKKRKRICQRLKNWLPSTATNGSGSGLIPSTKSWSTLSWVAIPRTTPPR